VTLSLFESTKNGCPHEVCQMKQTKTENVEKKKQKCFFIPLANAVIDPRTVVIHANYTTLALATMM